jgi:hypothetical protein
MRGKRIIDEFTALAARVPHQTLYKLRMRRDGKCPRCGQPPGDHVFCAKCRGKVRSWMAARRRGGKCPACSRRPAKGYVYCVRCRRKNRLRHAERAALDPDYNKKRYNNLKAQGKCPKCRSRRRHRTGHVLCLKCRAPGPAHNEKRMNRYYRLKRQGRCPFCASKHGTKFVNCPKCRERMRNYYVPKRGHRLQTLHFAQPLKSLASASVGSI